MDKYGLKIHVTDWFLTAELNSSGIKKQYEHDLSIFLNDISSKQYHFIDLFFYFIYLLSIFIHDTPFKTNSYLYIHTIKFVFRKCPA